MKSGMEMMLESMGIQTTAIKQLFDPNNVKALITKVETMCNTIDEIKGSVLRVEIKLGTLPSSIAMQLLNDGQSDAFQKATEYVREYNGSGDNGNGGSIARN